MNSKLRMVITGGGTGGHFFPAQAIINSLRSYNVNVKYIGSKYGIESKYYHKNNKDATLLNIRGFQRDINLNGIGRNLLLPFRFIVSYYKSFNLLRNFNPHIVIGTGGYSSALPLLAAVSLGIKTIIQEQNSYPGITTKIFANKAERIFLAFNDATKYFKKKNFTITGNPIRENLKLVNKLKAKQSFNLVNNKYVLAIMGGSQGSVPLNNYFIKNYSNYINSNIQILWQCGENDYPKLKALNNNNIKIIPFVDNMNTFYSAADLIVSRSGALALSEMSFLGKAMILIPLPSSAGNHQFKNAKSYSNKGAAIIINQSELNSNKLEDLILNLFSNPNNISTLEKHASSLGIPDSLKKITDKIMEVAKN